MDTAEIIKYLDDNNIQKIKFAFTDIDGILRGKLIHRKKFIKGIEDGYGFCDVVFGWDISDTLYEDVKVTGWHSGYPDKPVSIDLSTLREIPWQENIPFFLADFSRTGKEGLAVCPRTLLKKVIAQADSLGYQAEFAQEFEWFNFIETPHSLEQKHYINPQPLTPGMFGYSILRTSMQSDFYYDLFNLLERFQVPLEGLHTETGPGVYEAALIHDSVLKAADKAVLFKNAVKEIAAKHGIMASFMAKWNEKLPGCSGHIHQSLWDKEMEHNLFFDATHEHRMSELMEHYVAGQLYCLPQILPMYAPTINSYKRLIDGAWAPTTVSWGIENRTTAVRIINSSASYTRAEMRVPGSDSNPYLAMAAALASGLYGIRNKLKLQSLPVSGNAYDGSHQRLPANLYEATRTMQTSETAKELFGQDFVEHFAQTRLWEWKQYNQFVSNWELKRYFEII